MVTWVLLLACGGSKGKPEPAVAPEPATVPAPARADEPAPVVPDGQEEASVPCDTSDFERTKANVAQRVLVSSTGQSWVLHWPPKAHDGVMRPPGTDQVAYTSWVEGDVVIVEHEGKRTTITADGVEGAALPGVILCALAGA